MDPVCKVVCLVIVLNIVLKKQEKMIQTNRWFWNDKEFTKDEYDEINESWKRSVEEMERKESESEDKPKRKKKNGKD